MRPSFQKYHKKAELIVPDSWLNEEKESFPVRDNKEDTHRGLETRQYGEPLNATSITSMFLHCMVDDFSSSS